MTPIETERLTLRRLTPEDADFIRMLVNDPDWLRHIGDRGVRTAADARAYIRDGPMRMYAAHGFGLYAVLRKPDGAMMGLCGIIKRDTLPDFDLGFAFLPPYRGQGYAREAAQAAIAQAREDFRLRRLLAITSLDNARSIRLLEGLGFRFERVIKQSPQDPGTRLYAMEL
ncbi:MAG TPA: GNAT family N-acetyltransferase [Alphaproteobacteria bacterium]|jgi:ribosomal-protein-alanine N-acetyltransferase|nr:GNAT family N-acetyltransferase [Alphaproteobacteria bacterium]